MTSQTDQHVKLPITLFTAAVVDVVTVVIGVDVVGNAVTFNVDFIYLDSK